MAGQLVQGRIRYAEVELFRHDTLFKKSLSPEYVYAPETIRLYFEKLADLSREYTLNALTQVNLNLLTSVELTPVKTEISSYIPVDIDVSPMDNSGSKKEGVGRIYKGHDNFPEVDQVFQVTVRESDLRPYQSPLQNCKAFKSVENGEFTLKSLKVANKYCEVVFV